MDCILRQIVPALHYRIAMILHNYSALTPWPFTLRVRCAIPRWEKGKIQKNRKSYGMSVNINV